MKYRFAVLTEILEVNTVVVTEPKGDIIQQMRDIKPSTFYKINAEDLFNKFIDNSFNLERII